MKFIKYIVVEQNNLFYPKTSFFFGLIHIPFYHNRRERCFENFTAAVEFIKTFDKERRATPLIHDITID